MNSDRQPCVRFERLTDPFNLGFMALSRYSLVILDPRRRVHSEVVRVTGLGSVTIESSTPSTTECY